MSRKRWRTTLVPTLQQRIHQSQKAAYEEVARHRDWREAGMSRIYAVKVEVSEDRGAWHYYERIHFGDTP